jgi:hypothetical protein
MNIGPYVAYCLRCAGLQMEVGHHDKPAGSIGDDTSHIVCSVSGLGTHLRPP